MQWYFTFAAAMALAMATAALAHETPSPHVRTVSTLTHPASTASEPTQLATIVVTGSQPGPDVWRVIHGEHELFILGTLSPLPSGITWQSERVMDLVSNSQEIIWAPYFMVDADVGFFKKLYLGWRMYRAEKNPDGKQLKDVLPPDIYTRWRQVKQRYLPGSSDLERMRPLLAAKELFNEAVRQTGLSQAPIVNASIRSVLQTRRITSTTPHITVTLTDPVAALKEAQHTVLNDVSCLQATLDVIEYDLPRMVVNANAWATGNLAHINLDQFERRERACSDALSQAEFARSRGIPEIPSSMKKRWIEAAKSALATNDTTFAVLPIQDIIGPDGYIESLRAEGYVIDPP